MLRWLPNPVPYGPGLAVRRRLPYFSASSRAQGARDNGKTEVSYPLPGTRSVRVRQHPQARQGPGAHSTQPPRALPSNRHIIKASLNSSFPKPKRAVSNSFNAALFGPFSGVRERTRFPSPLSYFLTSTRHGFPCIPAHPDPPPGSAPPAPPRCIPSPRRRWRVRRRDSGRPDRSPS